MNIFQRIAIGTANWGEKPYGHRGVTCPRDEQQKILDYCQSVGIDTIHTKRAYGADLSSRNTFSRYRIIMEDNLTDIVSFYDPTELLLLGKASRMSIAQVPYSPFDRQWEPVFWRIKQEWAKEVWVRSCFLQGKVFTSDEPVFVRFRRFADGVGLPVGTLCILFCLMNPHVDKVILGVDSADQLRENLCFFEELDSFAVEDLSVIDPRRWPTKDPCDLKKEGNE